MKPNKSGAIVVILVAVIAVSVFAVVWVPQNVIEPTEHKDRLNLQGPNQEIALKYEYAKQFELTWTWNWSEAHYSYIVLVRQNVTLGRVDYIESSQGVRQFTYLVNQWEASDELYEFHVVIGTYNPFGTDIAEIGDTWTTHVVVSAYP